jgi:hypothetical protein
MVARQSRMTWARRAGLRTATQARANAWTDRVLGFLALGYVLHIRLRNGVRVRRQHKGQAHSARASILARRLGVESDSSISLYPQTKPTPKGVG